MCKCHLAKRTVCCVCGSGEIYGEKNIFEAQSSTMVKCRIFQAVGRSGWCGMA